MYAYFKRNMELKFWHTVTSALYADGHNSVTNLTTRIGNDQRLTQVSLMLQPFSSEGKQEVVNYHYWKIKLETFCSAILQIF